MKRFLIAIMAFVVVISAKGASIVSSLTNQTDVTLTYQSVDVDNNPITLSTRLYYPKSGNIQFVMINCHATITHNTGCPTGSSPQLDVVKYMTTENALVVCPDYIGFGQSSGKTHPYMCSTITGRNVLDAYKAAIKYVKEKGKTIVSGYYTINVGYSQGGATALAFQRYLETEASDADRLLVNLRGSVCGAGPYSQQIVFDVCEKGIDATGKESFKTLDYPIYLLYVLNGHKEAFGKSVMRKLELEECFTTEFWTYCKNGFMDKLNAKEKNVDELNTELKNAGFTTFYSIINADYKNRDSKLYRTIHKALEKSNLLADGWTPSKDIIFYHDHVGNDIVVPYDCTVAAMAKFAGHCSYVDAVDDYGYDGTRDLWGNTSGENFLWHPAVFHEYYHYDSSHAGQATIIAMASITGSDSYDFSQLDHRTFGARFYAQFLGERNSMRPEKHNPASTGSASTTNVDPATPTSVSIAGTEASAEDKVDRVEMALTYPMVAGKPTFLQFPADLDGYYFGCDASRYEVTLNANGEAVSYTKMADLTDFEAGKVYLVTSPDADQTITFVSPAQKKNVIASDLAWRELNMRVPNAAKGKSYISNYLPFAYTTPEGSTAYAMTESSRDDVVLAKPFTTVPVGTGTLIETEEPEDMLVLSPVDANEGEAVSGNLLIGHYEDVTNDKTNYYHFGISDNDNLGYLRYPNMETVKAYSSYMNRSNASANGFTISFVDDSKIDIEFLTRLIDALINKTSTSSYYDVNGDGVVNKADIEKAAEIILSE